MVAKDWNKRKVEYENLHDVKEEDMKDLVSHLSLKDGDTFADLFGGYGSVSKKALEYYGNQGKNVNAIICDFSEEQLRRVSKELENYNVKMVQGDTRSIDLGKNSLDGIVMKMGLHEIPQKDQQSVVNKAYDALKPGGKIAIWDLMFKDREEQDAVQSIVRKKDYLAGFQSMVKDRYFFREDEVRDYLKNAGFKNQELKKEINYNFDTQKIFYSELNRDREKLASLNNHIRETEKQCRDGLKERFGMQDNVDNLSINFRKGILVANKPYVV